MGEIFWYFFVYSFFGFLLEIAFARLIHSPKPDRKCHLLLPVCPVYGLGALAILALPNMIKENPFLLYLSGGLAATSAEWLMAVFYEKVAGTAFWNYHDLPFNLSGRVCLWFSLFWGFLTLPLVYLIHPAISRWVAMLPRIPALPAAALYLTDAVVSLVILRRQGTEGLRWYRRLKPTEAR
ncbi:MAG: putative ABC transporter permease [Oscillospiraceae bacterium]|nr:putative ABC transporter permease [Oscillospiraceae bacterium]